MKDQTNAVAKESNLWMIGSGVLVAGLIVGFLIGWFWSKNVYQPRLENGLLGDTATNIIFATSTAPVPGTIYQKVSADNQEVSVVDQKAGNLVFVQHANVSLPTWVAVREIVNDSVGNILGAEMVTSATDDVPVTLLRATKAGEKYAVFLYQDDGNGVFDFKKDLLVMSGDAPVSAVFVAQ